MEWSHQQANRWQLNGVCIEHYILAIYIGIVIFLLTLFQCFRVDNFISRVVWFSDFWSITLLLITFKCCGLLQPLPATWGLVSMWTGEEESPSDGSSLLVLNCQGVSDAFLDRWCAIPIDGMSDGVSSSAKQVSSDLASLGWWRGGNSAQTRTAPSAPRYPLSGGSRIYWIWSSASSLHGFDAEMSWRMTVLPRFNTRDLGKWRASGSAFKLPTETLVFSGKFKRCTNDLSPSNPLQSLEETHICTSRTSSARSTGSGLTRGVCCCSPTTPRRVPAPWALIRFYGP